jgi:hypothetical protein
MRLLHSATLQLCSFENELKAPPYAILSHTWGEDEVSFEDLDGQQLLEDRKPQGAHKILACANQTKKDGLEYLWIDTCRNLMR